VKLAVTYPDAEILAKDYLQDRIAELDEDITVAVGVPDTWTPAHGSHVQVASDGVPREDHPIALHHTIRLVGWSDSTTEAKRIATLAMGLLAAHPGGDGIASTEVFTGPLPARDPDTHAELCAVTLRVPVRSTPIEPSGS
jgi:hypothetical protein